MSTLKSLDRLAAGARPSPNKDGTPVAPEHTRRWQDKRAQKNREDESARPPLASGTQGDDGRSAHDDSHRDPVRDTRSFSRDLLF